MPQKERIAPQEKRTCGKQRQRRNQTNGFSLSEEPHNWMSRLLRRRRLRVKDQQGPIEVDMNSNQPQRDCGRRQHRRVKSNLF